MSTDAISCGLMSAGCATFDYVASAVTTNSGDMQTRLANRSVQCGAGSTAAVHIIATFSVLSIRLTSLW